MPLWLRVAPIARQRQMHTTFRRSVQGERLLSPERVKGGLYEESQTFASILRVHLVRGLVGG